MTDFRPNAVCPLDGIKVLDLSRLVAGNTLTMALADLGADVIKVEPDTGDTLRHWEVAGVSTAWKAYSRNKRSISLNLRSTQAIQIVKQLVATAQVFVESFRPGILEKMGLSPEVLLECNPKLVIVRITGWGQDGPYAHRPGFGTLVEGMSGYASMNGFADREPVLPPIYLGDMVAGLYGAIGVLTALREVEVNGGLGQVIDLSLLDSLFSIMGPQAANFKLTAKVKQRTGSRSTNSAPRNAYRTSDGKWVCLSASTQSMAMRTLQAVGRADLCKDPRFASNQARLDNVEELDRIICAFIEAMTLLDCLKHFESNSVTLGPIYDISDIVQDPHFLYRGIVQNVPDFEIGTIPIHGVSPRLLRTPGQLRRAAPRLGENYKEVLIEAGLSEANIEALIKSGVLVFEKPAANL